MRFFNHFPEKTTVLIQFFNSITINWTKINPKTATNKQKVIWALLTIKNLKIINNKLKTSRIIKKTFDYYQDYFKEFIKNDFNNISKIFRTVLKNIFIQKNIYIKRYNTNFAITLVNIII